MRDFFLVWIGQTISGVGSSLTAFALGIWVYQANHSVTQFGLVLLFASVPNLLVSPLAGALADRFNRRNLMLVSDTGAALGTLFVAIMLWQGGLAPWHVYLATAVGSAFGALRWPAYSASIPLIVPKKDLNRANGMVQLSFSVAELAAPFLAGVVLLNLIGLAGVVIVDFATYAIGVVTLLLARIPNVAAAAREESHLWRDVTFGWSYLRARRGLLALLVFFAVTNPNLGFLQELVTPLVLSFSSERTLGVIATLSGIGMLLGSVLMTVWSGPRRLVPVILWSAVLQGIVLFVAGLDASALFITIGGFFFLFFYPVATTCSQTLWQRKVATEVQGRVFAMRQMVATVALPVAYLLGGPLADRVFSPLMMPGGALAGSVGRVIGVGLGRGEALFIIVLGVVNVVIALAGFLYAPLRQVEVEVPDAVPDEAPATQSFGDATAQAEVA